MNQTYPVKLTDGGILFLEMPEELTILEDFMIIDLNINNIQEYLHNLEEALIKGTLLEVTGNTTTLCINKDKTVVYNNSIDQECTIDTEELREIMKLYLKETLLYSIEKDIKKKQTIYEKAKTVNSIPEILKLREDLQQDKII
jgi:hypothetical protein